MLSMVLHELATNASKYGALANGSGRIEIQWELLPGQRLRLTWKETGGPPVRPAERKGFGTMLIEEAFASQVGGSASLEYSPEGIVCTLECQQSGASSAGRWNQPHCSPFVLRELAATLADPRRGADVSVLF